MNVVEKDAWVAERHAEKQTYECSIVLPEHVSLVWKHVRSMLEPAVERSCGRWTMEHLYHAVASGNQLLWVVFDSSGEIVGTLTTQLVKYPNTVILAYQFLGGSGFDKWFPKLTEVTEDYAKKNGCSGVEATARFGFWPWFKTTGYNKSYCIYDKSFED